MKKNCTKCNTSKPLSQFYFVKTRNIFTSACKKCETMRTGNNVVKSRRIAGSYAWWYRKYGKIKRRAKIKKQVFNLTLEDFKKLRSKKICLYCKQTKEKMSIDRVDNSRGYLIENCVSVCWDCNRRKSDMSLEFIKNLYFICKKYTQKTAR